MWSCNKKVISLQILIQLVRFEELVRLVCCKRNVNYLKHFKNKFILRFSWFQLLVRCFLVISANCNVLRNQLDGLVAWSIRRTAEHTGLKIFFDTHTSWILFTMICWMFCWLFLALSQKIAYFWYLFMHKLKGSTMLIAF